MSVGNNKKVEGGSLLQFVLGKAGVSTERPVELFPTVEPGHSIEEHVAKWKTMRREKRTARETDFALSSIKAQDALAESIKARASLDVGSTGRIARSRERMQKNLELTSLIEEQASNIRVPEGNAFEDRLGDRLHADRERDARDRDNDRNR